VIVTAGHILTRLSWKEEIWKGYGLGYV